MPTFRCECGAVLHAGAEMAGEKCVCSNCRRSVRVPFDAPGPTSGSAPGTGRMAGMFTVFLIAAAVFLAAGLVLAALLAHAIWIAVGAAAALIPVACSLRLLYAYKAEWTAQARKLELEAEAHPLKAESDILGKEAIALREVLTNTNPSFIGLPSFLEQFFGRISEGLGKT